MSNSQTGAEIVKTRIPARLDRLPWSRFHWIIVFGLGTVWILDGLEATLVGSMGGRLTESGSGISLNAGQIGMAAAFYIAGACSGALFFGQLTDRLGRKRLFGVTLGLYILASVATGFSFAAWFFFAMRFLAGVGIGGEYAAINSAIDEFIPARVRGRVGLIINGSYWLGAAGGSMMAMVLLDTALFAANVGWRLAFGIGVTLGVAIMLIRRHVPESPRWLFVHGRQHEANEVVNQIEENVAGQTGQKLSFVRESVGVRARERTPLKVIVRTAFVEHPRRTTLCLALFIGQAFLYNAITFNLGTLLSEFFNVSAGQVPLYIVLFALTNFLGPLTLGHLFDTVGRKPMVTLTYLGSAGLAATLGFFLLGDGLDKWSFMAFIFAIFFLASAGASAAYLTVSETFPMEMRALSIAFFYAVGTGLGGIIGPLLFGNLINSGSFDAIAVGFFVGAAVMAVGGLAEIFFGVESEQRSLEDAAQLGTTALAVGDSQVADSLDNQVTGDRIRRRKEQRKQRERSGLHRYLPGPGHLGGSRGMTTWVEDGGNELTLDEEIAILERALYANGTISQGELSRRVGGRYWGPGRFHTALKEAEADGSIKRLPHGHFVSARDATKQDRN